jgi:hypothetical protein
MYKTDIKTFNFLHTRYAELGKINSPPRTFLEITLEKSSEKPSF